MTTKTDFPPPRFGTQRDLSRPTLGGKVAKVAAALGTPLMPWQRYVADIACELDEHGLYYYREVRLLLPRQVGKTTLLRAKGTHRCLSTPRARHVYTAQTRNMALQRLETDFYDPISASVISYFLSRGRARPDDKPGLSRKNGAEHIRWLNGSRWWIDAVTKTSGHGPAVDEAHVDEAFAHADARIEQALRPAMITRPHAQLWVVSAAGDESSLYLLPKVLDGRERVTSGRPGRVACFEWSAPDDADADDPATWLACIPSLGWRFPDGGGTTLAGIAAERDGLPDDDFRRAYLGQWRNRGRADAVIPAATWDALRDPSSMIESNATVYVLDAAPMLTHASIVACGLRYDGRPHVEITGRGAAVDSRPGIAWVVPRCATLALDVPGFRVAIAKGSPAELLTDELLAAGVPVEIIPPGELPLSCGLLFRLATNDGLRHLGQRELDAAVATAAKKDLGDGLFIWSRRRSEQDITALYAASLAVHLATQGQLPPNIW